MPAAADKRHETIPAGFITIHNVALHHLLPRKVLADATAGLPMEVAQATVGCVRFRLPSLSRWTITVYVSDVDVALRQKSLPEVRPRPHAWH